MMKVLELDNVSIGYAKKSEAIKNVSLDLSKGDILAIVGESGSGKSTILKSIKGVLPSGSFISKGDIRIFGRSINKMSSEEMRVMRGLDVAIVFQDAGTYLNPKKKIGVQFIETIQNHRTMKKNEAKELAVDMLYKVDLRDPIRIMDSYVFQLSGGMRQRVAIAMAMVLKPRLLLADEPTSALDVTIQSDIVKQMLKLRQESEMSIIIVTHNIALAANMADYIAVMKNGELVEYGKVKSIINEPKNAYTQELIGSVFELEG